MSQKQTNIVILLAILVIIIFVTLGFFGFGGFPLLNNSQATGSSESTLVDELQQTGTVKELRVQEIAPGTGDGAKAGDVVTVNYTGVLPDGTVFDASANHGQPFSFTLGEGRVIQGWEQGILGMKKGERRLLAIPPSLGYGANANGAIPANSTLIFEVEMLEIKSGGAVITP
jgi:FKBP-type peptidyl-prolyl cis-trans isomerase